MQAVQHVVEAGVHGAAGGSVLKKQLASFGLVGILNTLLDFAILNVGLFMLGLPIVAANIISTSAAMAFSFTLNNRWVFAGTRTSRIRTAILFVIVTAVGLYVLQSVVIFVFARIIVLPSEIAFGVANLLHLGLSEEFVRANTAKLIATIVSLAWNFVLYKRFVFKH